MTLSGWLTYPGGTNQVSYGYDNANRLTAVTDWNSNATAYGYDDAGRMTTATLPSGTGIVSTYSYDAADRLTGISHVKNGSTTVASVSYTLDDVGNRTQRVDQQGTHTYAYDDLHRLTSVTYPGPSTTSYAFDAFGNRTSMTTAGGTTTYSYDDADRLTQVQPPSPAPSVSYSWDDNGNLTNRGSDTFSWDYEDRMVSATVNSVTTTFAYRGDGLRDSRTVGANTTTFTWDIAAGLPVVLDDGNQYVYGAGLVSMKQSGNWYYYLADGLGSTMAVVDSSGNTQAGYTYDVYGTPTKTGSLANEFDFAGQQTDATGLQYLRARYYDPETGTFLSREPLAELPGWTGNSTSYGAQNPARMIDPSGERSADSGDNPVNWSGPEEFCWLYQEQCPGSFPPVPDPLAQVVRSLGNGALELTKLLGEYGVRVGDGLADWLRDNKDAVVFVAGEVLGAALSACVATGFGAAGGPWGVAACGGVLGAYLAFSAWYISDSESDFEKFIRVINQIPYPGGSRTGTIAKALFDALSSALDWTTPGGVR